MSKVYFSVQFPHDSPLRPKFSLATTNLYGVDFKGMDFLHPSVGNGNLNKGYKNRMEYAVKTQKGVTGVSVIMNTSLVLPNASWSPFVAKSKEEKVNEEAIDPRGPGDDRHRRSHRRINRDDDSRRISGRERERCNGRSGGSRRHGHGYYSDSDNDDDDHDIEPHASARAGERIRKAASSGRDRVTHYANNETRRNSGHQSQGRRAGRVRDQRPHIGDDINDANIFSGDGAGSGGD